MTTTKETTTMTTTRCLTPIGPDTAQARYCDLCPAEMGWVEADDGAPYWVDGYLVAEPDEDGELWDNGALCELHGDDARLAGTARTEADR